MMDLHLNDEQQQLLKSVLHALYHTFRQDPGMNTGTCRVANISREDLKTMIRIHDNIVDHELRNPDDEDPMVKDALDYVREQLGEDELAVFRATVTKNLYRHMPACWGLDDGYVIDLLEEYGEDYGQPEGWWENAGDIDDWFMKL